MLGEKSGVVEPFELTICADKHKSIVNAQSKKYERCICAVLISAIDVLDNHSCELKLLHDVSFSVQHRSRFRRTLHASCVL